MLSIDLMKYQNYIGESMKLKKLTLTNFRSYENFEINFNEKLNVIVAENGAGKTTILALVP